MLSNYSKGFFARLSIHRSKNSKNLSNSYLKRMSQNTLYIALLLAVFQILVTVISMMYAIGMFQ